MVPQVLADLEELSETIERAQRLASALAANYPDLRHVYSASRASEQLGHEAEQVRFAAKAVNALKAI